MAGLQPVSPGHLAEDGVAVRLRDVLAGAQRLPPSEARLRVELLVELGMPLDRGAGQRAKVAGGHEGAAFVGPAVGITELAIGEAEALGERVHLPGEGL